MIARFYLIVCFNLFAEELEQIFTTFKRKAELSQYGRSLHRMYPSESQEAVREGNSACWLSSISGSGHTGLVCKKSIRLCSYCIFMLYDNRFEKSRFYVILKTSIFLTCFGAEGAKGR